MLVALGFCAESGVLLAQIRVAHIVEGVSVSDAKTLQVRKSHSLTQDHLARDGFLINSFVAGIVMFQGFQSQLPPKGCYLPS